MPKDQPINVLLIGGGGREHALARSIVASPRLGTLFASHTQNPGIGTLARPVDVPVSIREIYRLSQFCEKNRIGLVVVGPEEPLAEGFADRLSTPHTRVFGPRAEAARLEADKAWSKQLMRSASIPTAEARIFSDPEPARRYIESRVADDPVLAKLFASAERYRDPEQRRLFLEQSCHGSREIYNAFHAGRTDLPVIKASGLAKGKGVILPGSLSEALLAIERIMVRREFGNAGRQIVIEEKLEGREVSVLAITDGQSLQLLPPAQDHKRLGDADTGPNTGGMGAFCPAQTIDAATLDTIERDILVPTLDALRREGIDYCGVLYAGLMLTHAGPKVLEFNVRFGDPECQAILPRLKSDLITVMLAACDRRLDQVELEWDPVHTCCVVMAAKGYPDSPVAGTEIHGLEDAADFKDLIVFHAGTRRDAAGRVVTGGGRVLGVTGLGPDLAAAREKAYAGVRAITFDGAVFRTDIGIT